MGEVVTPDQGKHIIICALTSDGQATAIEAIVDSIDHEELFLRIISGTERELPLSRAEAEAWVTEVMQYTNAEQQMALVAQLCSEQPFPRIAQ